VLGIGWFGAITAEAGAGKTFAVASDGAGGLLAVLAACWSSRTSLARRLCLPHERREREGVKGGIPKGREPASALDAGAPVLGEKESRRALRSGFVQCGDKTTRREQPIGIEEQVPHFVPIDVGDV
jgi:hypothetical protein